MAERQPYYAPQEPAAAPRGKGPGFWLGCAGIGCLVVLLVGVVLGLIVWRTVGTHIESGMNVARLIAAVEQERLDLQQLDQDFPLDAQNPPPVDEALIERYRAARAELASAFGGVLEDWMGLAETLGRDAEFSKENLRRFNEAAARALPLIDEVAVILRRYSIGPDQYRHVAAQGWLRLTERAAEPGSTERREFEAWLEKMRPLMSQDQAGQSPEQLLEQFRGEMLEEVRRMDDPVTEESIRRNWALWSRAQLVDFAVDQALIFLERDLMVEEMAVEADATAVPQPTARP